MLNKRNKTPSKYMIYALQLYFSGLSLRKTSQQLSQFIKGNHVSIWKCIQRYKQSKIFQRRSRVSEFIIDETLLKVGNQSIRWIAIGSIDKVILDIHISFERTVLIAETFIKDLVRKYGKHSISTDDGGTWYPQACNFLNIDHHLHSSSYEKSLIERTIQYIKDRTESFDDYFPCTKEKCKLEHIRNWFNLFVDYHNKEMMA